MDISRLGVFAFLDSMDAAKSVDFARAVQRLGYSTLWIVEGLGRNSLTYALWLLAKTDSLVVGTGVASIWARAASRSAGRACRLEPEDARAVRLRRQRHHHLLRPAGAYCHGAQGHRARQMGMRGAGRDARTRRFQGPRRRAQLHEDVSAYPGLPELSARIGLHRGGPGRAR